MTIQEAYKKIISSEELKQKAKEALKAGKGDEFLKEQGIDISMNQIREYVKSKRSGELSKTELDMATGGCDDDSTCNVTILSIAGMGLGCLASIIIGAVDDNDSTFVCV